jgi:nucleotide-binding universal stress UspA family protein
MLTLRSILCPVDFSDHARNALRWAVAVAGKYRSRLIVFTAVDPLLAEAARTRFGLDLAQGDTEPALRDFVRAAMPPAASWLPHVDVDVRVGDPSELILEAADRERADLIVMGTHGLGGFHKLLLGSTTERVLRRTRTPLLAVSHGDSRAVVLDAAGPRFEATTVLVATDFSESAADAVRCAATLAGELAAPLLIAHVVAPVIVRSEWQPYVEGVVEEAVARAQKRLDTLRAGLSNTIRSEVVVQVGGPADAIAALAEERAAGLVVMGLVGQQDWLAPRPGSIAYRVLCLARVPVLVVPPLTS